MAATGTSNKGLLFRWAYAGKSGCFIPAFLSGREAFSSSVCNEIQQKAHRGFLNKGQNLGGCGLPQTSVGRRTISPDCPHFGPFFLLGPRTEPRVGAASSTSCPCSLVIKAL